MTRKEQQKHRAKLRRIRQAGERKKLRDELRAERQKYFPPHKPLTTSKLALAYILISCTVVQVYSMAAMWHMMDLSPLATLIGATVGEAIAYCAYVAKSARENTAGGIVYDTALLSYNDPATETTDTGDNACG